ncbi:MAG: DUF1080 domain-containing protein, partial [Pyrinomonadaceae bacterium]
SLLWLFALSFCCGLQSVAAQSEQAFMGKWDITATGPKGSFPLWLEVKTEDGKLAGYFLNHTGSVLKVAEISVEGSELVFSPARGGSSAPKAVHRAKVTGGKLVGAGGNGTVNVEWVGVRPPKWGSYNASGNHKFGAPVELFDSKGMDNWEVQYKDRPLGWSVADGAMTNEAKANNIISKQQFKDFKIQAEYKLEAKSNSGIYLRGRYELQVLDDAGKEAESHGHMAIYSRTKPLTNASLAAGEWQMMEAIIVGNRVTVRLNGKTLHDNALIEGITGGALNSDEAAPGPIMLQGDHGKVWFRKVTVTPIVR